LKFNIEIVKKKEKEENVQNVATGPSMTMDLKAGDKDKKKKDGCC
jgi:hypothetical protein